MLDGSVNPEQQVAGREERLLQENKTYEEISGRRRQLERQLQEEYERGISNPKTFLAFLAANRDHALLSRHRDYVWGERGKRDLLHLAIRCQRTLNGDWQERAAFCSEEDNNFRSMAQELSTRTDAFYRDYRQSYLASGIQFPYPKDWKGKKLEERTEEEWTATQREQDQEDANELLKKAALWSAMTDAVKKTMPASA